MAHLLPLTKYVVNGQYVKVQPIATNSAEPCICTILTRNLVVEVVAHLRHLAWPCGHRYAERVVRRQSLLKGSRKGSSHLRC